jgi:hypothetical protein
MTNIGPGSNGPMWKQPGTPGCIWPSSAAMRSFGRRAGNPAPTARIRQAGLWCPIRTPIFFNAPTDPVSWTGIWRDSRFGTASGGGNPENSLTEPFFMVNSRTTDIVVPSTHMQLRMWRGTTIAGVANGASATLGAGLGTLGYEWDIDADKRVPAPGSFRLSQTNSTSAEIFTDYGSTVKSGSASLRRPLQIRPLPGRQ